LTWIIGKQADTVRGQATITMERGGMPGRKSVPARVCANCGEEYREKRTTQTVLKTEIREDVAA
jgi:hypothetical protein